MTKYRVKSRVYCMGRQYEPGDECDGNVARALGEEGAEQIADGALVSEEGAATPVRKTKPLKKASLK